MEAAVDGEGPGPTVSSGLVAKIERRLARGLHRRRARLRNTAPIVTFTFDDVPRSACTGGRGLLERHAAQGTFYVCGGFTDAFRTQQMHSRDDLASLQRDGHEIACHGFGHLDYQAVDLARVREDMRRNRQFLGELGVPAEGLSFAYPFGCVSPGVKREAGEHYASARGVVGGSQVGHVDLNLLQSVPLYSSTIGEAGVTALIEGNARAGGWLIFFTHGVEPDPLPHGCEPSLLDHALRCAIASGSQVLPMRAVLSRCVLPAAA